MITKILMLIGAIGVAYSTSAVALNVTSFKVTTGPGFTSGFDMLAFSGLAKLKKSEIDGNAVLEKLENDFVDFEGLSQVTNVRTVLTNIDNSKLPGLASMGN